MSQHHGSAEDHSCGVGTVRAHDVLGDVTATRLEERVFLQGAEAPSSVYERERVACGTYPANVATGDDAGTTNEGGTNVRDDSTVQVRHNHHVELRRASD